MLEFITNIIDNLDKSGWILLGWSLIWLIGELINFLWYEQDRRFYAKVRFIGIIILVIVGFLGYYGIMSAFDNMISTISDSQLESVIEFRDKLSSHASLMAMTVQLILYFQTEAFNSAMSTFLFGFRKNKND